MSITHLIASDFDGTIAHTSIPSPHNITVEGTTKKIIVEMFGGNALQVYEMIDGLNSREPGEFVELMLSTARDRDVHLENDTADPDELTEFYIQEKLAEILPEISPEWPQLAIGFEILAHRIGQSETSRLAVISNGHDGFIREVFDVNKIPQPEILITSDTLRAKKMSDRCKPDPYSLELAKEQFLQLYGAAKPRVVYLGDSVEKDGKMARNANIRFGLYDPTLPVLAQQIDGSNNFAFRDFHVIRTMIWSREGLIPEREGVHYGKER